MDKIEILLVHNEFVASDYITYMSYGIRVVTCSKWNHIAIRINDEVIEAIGKGVIRSSYDDWFIRSDRQVLPLIPQIEVYPQFVFNTVGLKYGFRDLVERAKAIKNERWDGKSYIIKDFNGIICSDLACILLGIPLGLMPSDFENYPDMVKGKVYTTTKIK